MSMADAASLNGAALSNAAKSPPKTPPFAHVDFDILKPDHLRKRERFIPITRFALMDRLSTSSSWGRGQNAEVRRFFRYLDYWRQQQYSAAVLDLEQTYEPFCPDTDLLLTRVFTLEERREMRLRLIDGVRWLLERANYVAIDPSKVELFLTKDTYYGLDLKVDMGAFEHVLIYYRGASNRRHEKRVLRKFMRKQEFDVPIFQRLFLLFKLKPAETRIAELMAEKKISRDDAERRVRNARAALPVTISEDNVYMKMFKNIPRTDIEMVFPNTQVRFRWLDKLRLGVTAGGGLGMGLIGAAGKIAFVASNPLAAAGAAVGLGTIAFRQAMNFMNQKQRYMVVMAQNLYFHSLADNRGVLLKLAARGAEEDFKEEMLLYSVLAKETATRDDMAAIDAAVEKYLAKEFGVAVDFDLDDALSRLIADGLVVVAHDGSLRALNPREAAAHIDRKWDQLLDQLPEPMSVEGMELDASREAVAVSDQA